MTELSDAELITAVRAGDRDAYALLWGRHEKAARNLARQIAKPSDVDELVSESFYRVLRALAGGGGPDGAFRPYLLSTLRRLTIDVGRGYYQRVSLTDDDTDLEGTPGDSAAEIAIEQGEQSAAWKAWASLPDDSRTLLWHLIVEEETPTQIAPLLGTTPNGVSSRAVRAKERLRQAFLQQHIREADSEQCQWTRVRIGGYVRNALSTREHDAVARHLNHCRRCAAVVAEIADVNTTLKGAVAPVLLGGAAAGYLHARGTAHLVGRGRLRRHVLRPSVAAGAAAAATVTGITYALVTAHGTRDHPQAAPLPVSPPAAVHLTQLPPTHRVKPSPVPSTPTPTRTHHRIPPRAPAPTPTTRTPTRPQHHIPPPTPAPTLSSTTTSSTPTLSTPSPTLSPVRVQVIAQVTTHSRIHTGASTVSIITPGGWRIDGIATRGWPQTCVITSAHSALCRIVETHRVGYHISVTATGPRQANPPAMLQVRYRDSLGARQRNYPLAGPTRSAPESVYSKDGLCGRCRYTVGADNVTATTPQSR